MPKHDFKPLYAQYPAIIDQMPDKFSSHEFILCLAQQHQALYVEALYAYRNTIHRGKAAPFLIVHRVLSTHLLAYPNLVRRLEDIESVDIWGQSNRCAAWAKV